MKHRGTAVLVLVLAGMAAVPVTAQHMVTPGEAAAQVHRAADGARQDLTTVQSFLAERGADPALALTLGTSELAEVAGEIRAQQQQQKGASTGVYMLAGAGVLLILLLIIGLAVGSSE